MLDICFATDKDGLITGTQFAESPITVKLMVGESAFSSTMTSTKVQVRIYRKSSVSGSALTLADDYQDFEFGVENGETLSIDLQSGILALLGQNEFEPNANLKTANTNQQSIIEYVVALSYLYMQNGVLIDGFANSDYLLYQGGYFAIRGALTDMERYRLGDKGVSTDGALSLTRKPTTGEIVIEGMKYAYTTLAGLSSEVEDGATTMVQSAPSTTVVKVQSPSVGNPQTINGHTLYIDSHPDNYRQFCFINSLGVPETVCACTLESKSYDVEPTAYTHQEKVSRIPQLNKVIFTKQSETHQKFSMSSGNVTRDWAEWWTIEFLRASAWWMLLDDVWWPVSIEPEKKQTSVYDRSKEDALHIDFTVTLGMTGFASTHSLF